MVKKRTIKKLFKNKVQCIEEFLGLEECRNALAQLATCFWQPSMVVNRKAGNPKQKEIGYSVTRVSYTVFQHEFPPALQTLLPAIEERLNRQFKVDISKLEEWQAVNYEPGEFFEFHIDSGGFEKDPPGERARTFLIYLDQPLQGGSTFFRALDLEVSPEPGKLLVWTNLLPTGLPDYSMIHAGMPVQKGTKTILVTWERQFPCRHNQKTIKSCQTKTQKMKSS